VPHQPPSSYNHAQIFYVSEEREGFAPELKEALEGLGDVRVRDLVTALADVVGSYEVSTWRSREQALTDPHTSTTPPRPTTTPTRPTCLPSLPHPHPPHPPAPAFFRRGAPLGVPPPNRATARGLHRQALRAAGLLLQAEHPP
jgi:hypothetical protein